jgi:hypothetical protein
MQNLNILKKHLVGIFPNLGMLPWKKIHFVFYLFNIKVQISIAI